RDKAQHSQFNSLNALYWVFGAQFSFAFAMVVTFPYFSPYVQQYDVTSQAWIGFLYALPHGVYLLFAGKVHQFSEWVDRHQFERNQAQRTLWLGFGLLSLSAAMHLTPYQEVLIIARIV
ncbi:MFS transporter, partial [Vibrio lentus]|nr:MFS transporter [Vibrio lentus]